MRHLKLMVNIDSSSYQIYLLGISAINQFHINLTKIRSKGSKIRLITLDLRITTLVFLIIERVFSRRTASLLCTSLRSVKLLHDMDQSHENRGERIHHYHPGTLYHNLRISP